ncbi:hypothetical protein B5X24_HaOG214054 [Helicoverpa armigera]|uniref:Uncharacterized protein n=1 Tax=Helicoverpa armigera TaxID=29058 RepID=A0A2W1BB82_HELAM|nr:hypothetical protein B5X24_HaOG214054 [Helicoverpa armigera]
MHYIIVLFSIISFQTHITKATTTEKPAPIETRIELLKQELLYEMEHVREKDEYSDLYEYVDNSNKPITPISIFDKRKKEDKFKLPEIKPISSTPFVASDTSEDVDAKKPLRQKEHDVYKKAKKTPKPLEIFYRRIIVD